MHAVSSDLALKSISSERERMIKKSLLLLLFGLYMRSSDVIELNHVAMLEVYLREQK